MLPSLLTKVVLMLLLLPTLHSLHSSASCHSTDNSPTKQIHHIKKLHHHRETKKSNTNQIHPDWFWRRRSLKRCGNNFSRSGPLFRDEVRRITAFTPPITKKKERHQLVLRVQQRRPLVCFPRTKRKSHLFSSTREDLGHKSNGNGNSQGGTNRTRNNNLQSPSRIKKNPSSISPSPLPSTLRSQNYHSEKQKSNKKDPNHVAFICDGNSRWSISNKSKFIPNGQQTRDVTFWGHYNGATNVINLIKHIQKKYANSIHYVTMYAFSTENWSRDPSEIEALWNVLETFSKKFYNYVLQLGMKVKIIGDLDDQRIPVSLRDLLRKLESDSYSSIKDNHENCLTLCIAINYGGRKDIIDASLKMAELISRGEVILNDNNGGDVSVGNLEETFSSLLCTSNIPDPDLVIRTGGECRMSNFLIWNCAYSELYFTDTLWPDYSEEELDKAIEWYKGRERRFGGREQNK